MKLGEKQELFSRLFQLLLLHIHASGYEVRIKHALRCQECPVGHQNSLHKSGLAVDIVLSWQGKILTASEAYTFCGKYWESLHELAAWGGRFQDGGHFSITHNGMK